MASGPRVGDQAPDFELDGTEGRFRLSDHRGERVVLLFYPGDRTPVCTKQFCFYRDDGGRLQSLDATIVGISAQSVDSHRSFRDDFNLNVPLLADTDYAVARAYGAYRMRMTRRAVVIVDENGIVAHRHDHLLGLDFQTSDQIAEALATLPERQT